MKIRPVGDKTSSVDGQTDNHDETNVHFLKMEKVPKIDMLTRGDAVCSSLDVLGPPVCFPVLLVSERRDEI